ncbi:MAG: GTP 3',8-cyclase MoaA [Deltaproteobacteria bacterium]|nr:GTP 3',8-cyclase MoaA [Deltaproteobacteria bacterium]
MAPNTDPFHRKITYLRISITDRCNMRCLYCISADSLRPLSHRDILTYEEILAITRASVDLGITKVRITGGEPLIRRDVLHFIRLLCAIPGLKDVSITTNGTLLKDMAGPLFDAGIRRINISLDTLNPLKFRRITRRDHFHEVWDGISAANEAGFSPIKLNVVIIKGLNDTEILQFAALSIQQPYVIRFIEFMPIGETTFWDRRKVMTSEEIRSRLDSLGSLQQVPPSVNDGPAKQYRFENAKGKIGIITPISDNFCGTCNRLRLTADGRIRPCLFSDHEIDIKTPLRKGCTQEEIKRLLKKGIAEKPKRHYAGCGSITTARPMSKIGG